MLNKKAPRLRQDRGGPKRVRTCLRERQDMNDELEGFGLGARVISGAGGKPERL